MEPDRKDEQERIQTFIANLKSIQIDYYLKSNYCDAIDDRKNWSVAEVVDRNDDKVKIHFEGWPSKMDEILILSKTRRLAHFRKHTKGYTGPIKQEWRNYTFHIEDVHEIKSCLKTIRELKFNVEIFDNPLDVTQILRGRIYFYFDYFLTTQLVNPSAMIPPIIELIYEYLDFAIIFLKYLKDNLPYAEVIDRNYDLYLIDKKCAIVASYYEVTNTLKRIFMADYRTNSFFIEYGEYIEKYMNKQKLPVKEKICVAECYKSDRFYLNEIPAIIIANFIDYFNDRQGFSLLFEIIFSRCSSLYILNTPASSSEQNFISTPLYIINNLFAVFQYIHPLIDYTSHFSNEISKFKDFIFHKISNLTEAEIKEIDRTVFDEIALSMREVYNFDKDGLTSAMLSEEVRLSHSYKCFLSKNLEKRIKGISYINKIAEYLNSKDNDSDSMYQMNDNSTYDLNWMQSDYLFQWLKEKNLIEIILGENIHEEILKRSQDIFKFFVKKNALSSKVYDLMWKCLNEKHETISIQIKNLLCDLSLVMNEADKIYIFDKIKMIPFEKYDAPGGFLKFIKSLTVNCMKVPKYFKKKESVGQIQGKEKNVNFYGIPILWKCMQDDKVVLSPVDISYECLREIFTICDFEADAMTHYMTLCLENINTASSVVQSMKLLKILIAKISKDSYAIKDSQLLGDQILNALNQSYSIVELIVQDTERYMTKVIQNSSGDTAIKEIQLVKKKSATVTPGEDYRNAIFEGNYTHTINIDTRLKLILFLYSYSNTLQFSTDHISRLWTIFMLQSKSEVDRNIFCHFLTRTENEGENSSGIAETIQEFLFTEILINSEKNPPERMNYIGFNLFQKFFVVINTRNGNLLQLGRNIRIISIHLLGFNFLWDILTLCKNENVRRECSKLLVDICLNPKTMEEEFCIKLWTLFTNNVILTMQNCVDMKMENGIRGMILLIKELIKRLSNEGEISRSEDVKTYSNTFSLTFVYPEKNEKRLLQIGITEYVYEVREKISYYYDIPLQSVALKSNLTLIDSNLDDKFFRDLVDPKYIVEILIKPNPILSFRNINPKNLIMENKYIFDTLFELLHNSGSAYIDDALELINLLPKSKDLEQSINNLGKEPVGDSMIPEIERYLDSKSIYRLSYSLQTIKHFIDGDYQWAENFRFNGAVIHFISIITQFQESHFAQNSTLGFKCLDDILTLFTSIDEAYSICHCATISQGLSPKFFETDVMKSNQTTLIRKLFDIVLFIIKSSYLKDIDPVLKDLQAEHTKKRNKEHIHKLFQSKKQEDADAHSEEIDAIHEKIRQIWECENNTVLRILKFLEHFNARDILNNFIFTDDHQTFSEILTWGMIFPKNNQIKFLLLEYLVKFQRKDSIVYRTSDFYCSVFNTMLNEKVLRMCLLKPEECDPFFTFLKNIIGHCRLTTNFLEENKEKLTIDFLDTVKFMIGYIESYSKMNSGSETVLIGFMTLIRELVLSNRSVNLYVHDCGLFDLLITKCLFSKCKISSADNERPTCNSPLSRSASYKLVTAISLNFPEYIERILKILMEYHKLGYWRTCKVSDWFIVAADDKSSTGYTGLKNLGCTCYMNSLLQQFFMIPFLREAILASPDKDIFSNEESILFHLKYIFASLKATDRQYHNPRHFTSVFKNYEGQVMNVLEQMDVDEFFNLLIERLEPYLKKSPYENIFKYYFTGIISNELICKGCPHYSERKEPFNSISLQVKNKKSLLESLDTFVQGEMLMGDNSYLCEKCDKKVPTLRRQCIKKLPRILVIVLKRFEFDYDNMIKIKVNDYCEFPVELDMKPYTQEYLAKIEIKKMEDDDKENEERENEKYKYNLKGFIIHTGTADSGHYYSIIKSDEKWMEFNDTFVTEYDMNDLKSDAYGGPPVMTTTITPTGERKNVMMERSTNAYVLFYTRKSDDVCDNESPDEEKEKEKAHGEMETDTDTQTIDPYATIKTLSDMPITKTSNIQPNILDLIKLDNYKFWVGKIIFSNEYSEFVQDIAVNYNTNLNIMYKTPLITKNMNFDVFPLMRKESYIINLNIPDHFFISVDDKESIHSQDEDILNHPHFKTQMFKFFAFFFLVAGIRSKDRSMIPRLVDIMKANINFSQTNAEWIIEEFSNNDVVFEFLVDCAVNDMKNFTVGILYCAMIKVYSCIRPDNKEKMTVPDFDFIKENPLTNLLQVILSLIFQKQKMYIKKDFTFLYQAFYRFVVLGSHMRQLLIKMNFLPILIHYYYRKSNLYMMLPSGMNEVIMSMSQFQTRESLHNELSEKTMVEPEEKGSILDEVNEKKQMEKNIPSDIYLLLSLCEVLLGSDYRPLTTENPNRTFLVEGQRYVTLSDNDLKVMRFTDFQFARIIINECKSRLGVVHLSKLISYVCYENQEVTTCIGGAFGDLIHLWDYDNSGYLMRLFEKFLLIEDSLKESRMSAFLSKYFTVLMENLKYYKATEFHIDFIIKFYSRNSQNGESYLDPYKDYIVKLHRWLKDNPYPPMFFPSKTTQYYKKRQVEYSKNISQQGYQQWVNAYRKTTIELQDKLVAILKKNKIQVEEDDDDAEEDLTNFKFSAADRLRYMRSECIVQNVLDEMILLEYQNDPGNRKEGTAQEWIETSCSIRILELNGEINENKIK